MRVKTQSQTLVVLSFVVLIAGSLYAQSGASRPETSTAQKLPLRRVILYKSGVGYFEHAGTANGSESVEIDLTSSQLDDVLKSLTALDMNGGRISGASYNSQDPASHQLGALPVPIADRRTLSDLLQALRGAQVEVRSGTSIFAGRLLSVESKTKSEGNTSSRVCEASILSDAGEMRSFRIEPGTSLRFTDRELEEQLARALGLLDASHAQDTRRLVLSTSGPGVRELRVSYTSEVPVWKTTYRIVMPSRTDAQPLLQGWAIVDNTVGEDWNNVELSLAAGAPQSFVQQISQPYYARRPMVPMPVAFQLTPQTHAATMYSNSSSGTLAGHVADPQGAGIAGAEIDVLDSDGRRVAQSTSDEDGDYQVDGLAAGNYTVEIAKTGFNRERHNNVAIAADGASAVNANLRIGTVSETVNVEAGAALESFAVSGGTGGGSFGALPRVSRDSSALAALESNNVAFRAAAASINAAQGRPLGDLFEYKIKDRVSIRKNQSALVPIVQTGITAEKVTLWNAGLDSPRPLRALWFTNSSDLVLDGGTFSIVDAGAFAGEGILDSIEPGEKRLISYAIDLGVQVSARTEPEPGRVTRIRVSHGVMVRSVEVSSTVIYSARNEDTSARTLIIEHPVRSGFKLDADLHPDEKSVTAYRFRVPVASKKSVDFRVRESRIVDASYSITNLNSDEIKVFAQNRELSPELEKALREVVAQKDAIANLDTAIKSRQAQSTEIFNDQSRLRENMKSLRGSAEEKDLTQRYTKELGDQENRLESLRREISDLQVQRAKAQQDLDSLIEHMSFDITV